MVASNAVMERIIEAKSLLRFALRTTTTSHKILRDRRFCERNHRAGRTFCGSEAEHTRRNFDNRRFAVGHIKKLA